MAAGFWFDMFLVTLGVCALLAALAYPDSAASFLFLVCAALVFAFLLLFGVYILLGLLLWNTVQMLKRERPSLKHMLTLILALAILALMALPWVLGKKRIVSLAVSAVDGASGDGGLFRFAQPGVSDGVLCGKVVPAA